MFVAGLAAFLLARPAALENQPPPTPIPRYELVLTVVLVVLVMGVAIGLRFWRYDQVPYGVEQNELEWTVGAAHATYTDVDVPTSLYQRRYLPTSSFQERVFFDAFGMDVQSARLENAVFSTGAVLLFYFLVLVLSGRTPALIATFLMAISTLHIASARQANVESHVLFWAILSYLLFWLAVRQQSALLFLATGISVVLGLWTHETYNMTLAVLTVSIGLFALMSWRRWRQQALCMGMFFLPVALVARSEKEYLDSHHGYHFAQFNQTRDALHGPIWHQAWSWIEYFSGNLQTLFDNVFVHQTAPAYEFPMIRPNGAMLMAVVFPLASLGLLLVVRRPQRREHIFLVLWVGLQMLIVPAVLGADWGRVLLPATPALFVLAGLGGALAFQHVGPIFGTRRWLMYGSAVLLAVALVGVGARAYFYEVTDPEDRLIRRELVDVLNAQRDTPAYVILPRASGETTPRDRLFRPTSAELRFLLGQPPDIMAAQYRVRSVVSDQLVQAIRDPRREPWAAGPVRLVMEHRNQDPRLPVPEDIATVRACYTMNQVYSGTYFDVFEIPSDSLAHPTCAT
jgi:hypothetical protein